MSAGGKIQALNNAIRETIPHLRDMARQNPYAQMFVRAIAFSSGVTWHIADPVRIEELKWHDLSAGGHTDMGAALRAVADGLKAPHMPEHALPPALVLVSDGQPTDDFASGLQALLAEPYGAKAVRLAIGIGRDADLEVLDRFISHPEIRATTANNPEQLVRLIRWASRAVSSLASVVRNGESGVKVPQQPTDPSEHDTW